MRQYFGTYGNEEMINATAQRLLEDESNGIQKAVYDVILNGGQDTVSDIRNWDKMDFEGMISRHPKALIRFAG